MMSWLTLGTRLDRYIFRQLLLALIAVTGGLTALIWLTQSLRFVELVVNHGLSFGVFLRLTGLLIPSFVAVILPITTFVVVQFIYQRLSGDRELTVMRAAGVSSLALARPAIVLAFFVVGATYLLNLWLVPASLSAFKDFQWEIRNRMAAFLLQEGVFTQISDGLTIYIRTRDANGALRGILIDDGRNPNAHSTILAENGQILEGPNGPRALLLNGSRQEIDRQTGRLNILTFRENLIDLTQSTGSESPRMLDMSEAPTPQLLHPPSFLSKVDAGRWIAEAHKRLSSPLTALSYALIALVAVLNGTFRRHGGVIRPLIAIAVVVSLLALGLAFGNLAARDNALIPLLWLQAGVPGVIAAAVLAAPQVMSGRRRPLPAAQHAG